MVQEQVKNIKKTSSLRLGTSEGEEVMLGSQNADELNSFIYLGSIISKNSGCSDDVKSRLAKTRGVFHS